jgi:ABC-2 type transport system ATP-binding protein
LIEVAELRKRYRSATAVNGLSFRVGDGQITGFLGPNGAGKTTTIQLLLGLTTPTAGSAAVLGLDVQRERRRVLQRVNFSSAYISLPSNLTVRQNLRVFARLYGIRSSEPRIAELLERFEIPDIADRPTGALSSGQLTRVNLCKAFINDPEVLFLDEPTASLDPDIADKARRALRDIQRDRSVTIVYTSHNMREIELMCDRVIFLARGRAVTEGSPAEVRERAHGATLEDVFIAIARDGEIRETASSRD